VTYSFRTHRPGRVRIGDFFDTLGDIVSAPFNAAEDVTTSAWDDVKKTVPGAQAFSDAFDTVVTNPTRDFLNTDAGKIIGPTVMLAISGAAFAAAAPHVGAQLASATFALPGIMSGEKSFVKAWTEGMVHRITLLIDYFLHTGVPADLAPQEASDLVQQAMAKCEDTVSSVGIDPSKIDFHYLAKLAGVSEHDAALWLSQKLHDLTLLTDHTFDGQGREIPKGPAWGTGAAQKVAAALAAKQAELARQGALARTASASEYRSHLAALIPQLHPSAPELGALTGAGPAPPPPPMLTSAAAPAKTGLSTGTKVGLGALGAAALALLFFL
jgi:hypothetical protein